MFADWMNSVKLPGGAFARNKPNNFHLAQIRGGLSYVSSSISADSNLIAGSRHGWLRRKSAD